MKRNYKFYKLAVQIATAIISLTGIIAILIYFWNEAPAADKSILTNSIFALMFSAFLVGALFTLLRHFFDSSLEDIQYDKNLAKLNKVIQYNKQRKEIEQEIRRLTRELQQSNVAQYIDINRLAFSGQQDTLLYDSNNVLNYNNFFEQFGIPKDVKVKENSAVFLTPFDDEGEALFIECQTILGRASIFLQKTDNIVEKDDILMNIVSQIMQSELVLVNIDGRNPNVYYELGIAHAIGKQTILLSKANYELDDVGFDLRQKRIIIYKDKEDLETQLLYQINRIKRN